MNEEIMAKTYPSVVVGAFRRGEKRHGALVDRAVVHGPLQRLDLQRVAVRVVLGVAQDATSSRRRRRGRPVGRLQQGFLPVAGEDGRRWRDGRSTAAAAGVTTSALYSALGAAHFGAVHKHTSSCEISPHTRPPRDHHRPRPNAHCTAGEDARKTTVRMQTTTTLHATPTRSPTLQRRSSANASLTASMLQTEKRPPPTEES